MDFGSSLRVGVLDLITIGATIAVAGTAVLTLVSNVFGQWQNGEAVFGMAIQTPAGSRDLVIAFVMLLVLLLRRPGLLRLRQRDRRPHVGPVTAADAVSVPAARALLLGRLYGCSPVTAGHGRGPDSADG